MMESKKASSVCSALSMFVRGFHRPIIEIIRSDLSKISAKSQIGSFRRRIDRMIDDMFDRLFDKCDQVYLAYRLRLVDWLIC